MSMEERENLLNRKQNPSQDINKPIVSRYTKRTNKPFHAHEYYISIQGKPSRYEKEKSFLWFGKVDRPVIILMKYHWEEVAKDIHHPYPLGLAYVTYCYRKEYSDCDSYIHFYDKKDRWVGSIDRDLVHRIIPMFTMKGVEKFQRESGVSIKRLR